MAEKKDKAKNVDGAVDAKNVQDGQKSIFSKDIVGKSEVTRVSSDFVRWCLISIAAVILSYMISRVTGLYNNENLIQYMMMGGLFIVLMCGAGLILSDRATDKQKVYMLFIMGMIMRIGYMLYTPCTVRSHDLWGFAVEGNDGYGHAGYIIGLVKEGHLPTINWRQYYQQPFFYVLGGYVSYVINAILGNDSLEFLVDASKTVSCVASCVVMFAAEELMAGLNVKVEGRCVANGIIAFLPVFYLTGGRVGPDSLACMFMALAFLYTMYWNNKPDWKNTIILAVLYGLGMQTKISCGVVALFTAVIFLVKLWEYFKDKKALGLMVKYIVFGIISLPLGLWYGVRNYKLFKQPLTYVLELKPDSTLYTGNVSLFKRVIGIDFNNLFNKPYTSVADDYNAPVYYIKSSLFGEFKFNIAEWIPSMLVLINTALVAYTIVAIVIMVKNKHKNVELMKFVVMLVVYYCSTIYFYCKYPYGCSMDFRYMGFFAMLMAIMLGCFVSDSSKVWRRIAQGLVMAFGVFSCVMYCFC